MADDISDVDYIDMERKIQTETNNGAKVHNNDYVGAGSYNIFAGVFVAFVFGAAFFFDLIWPERHENQTVRWAWKICGILATIFHLASALTLTIITATHRSTITGVSPARATQLLHTFSKYKEAPLLYRHNGRAVAAVVFVWLGWVSVAASCILLFLGIANVESGSGPKSAHAEGREDAHWRATHTHDPEAAMSEAEKSADTRAPSHDTVASEAEKSVQEPEATHSALQRLDEAQDSTPYATPAAELNTSHVR